MTTIGEQIEHIFFVHIVHNYYMYVTAFIKEKSKKTYYHDKTLFTL